jgi:hypothetical protein
MKTVCLGEKKIQKKMDYFYAPYRKDLFGVNDAHMQFDPEKGK